jgi:hypothetical protein
LGTQTDRFGNGGQIVKKPIISTVGALTLCLLATFTWAGETDNHQVTVVVNPINEIAVTGGNITLNINTATAGNEPNAATDRTCDLLWTTNETYKKITVVSSLAKIRYTLIVAAKNLNSGTTMSEVIVGPQAVDFITNISKTTGSCDLQYVANATAAAGAYTETHTTVIYTLTDN